MSFAPELGDAVRDAARHSHSSVSAWLADAAAAKLRSQALAEYLAEWEAQHGSLTAEELARAASELVLPAQLAA